MKSARTTISFPVSPPEFHQQLGSCIIPPSVHCSSSAVLLFYNTRVGVGQFILSRQFCFLFSLPNAESSGFTAAAAGKQWRGRCRGSGTETETMPTIIRFITMLLERTRQHVTPIGPTHIFGCFGGMQLLVVQLQLL